MTATITTAFVVPAPAPAPKATALEPTTLETTRVEALFASYLQCSDKLTAESVRDAVTTTVRRHGSKGCAALVAQEFGEHPDTAVGRMRWALRTVRTAYAVR